MNHVGQEIRRLREARSWSQAQLAVYAGSSQPTVNQIETGKRNPSTATLQKLAEALEVPVSELFPKVAAPPSQEPSFNDVFEEERRESERAHRLQLLNELRQHMAFLIERFNREATHLEHDGTLSEWEMLERDSAFASIGAKYILMDESGAPDGLKSETGRSAWRAAHRVIQELDTVCDEIEAKTQGVREFEGQSGSKSVSYINAHRKRAG